MNSTRLNEFVDKLSDMDEHLKNMDLKELEFLKKHYIHNLDHHIGIDIENGIVMSAWILKINTRIRDQENLQSLKDQENKLFSIRDKE